MMKKLLITAGYLALPLVSSAQAFGQVSQWITSIGNIINIVIPILFAAALLAFFWGLVQFLWGGVEDKGKAKDLMIWGIVALFVMTAIWGLVSFLGAQIGINPTSAPQVQPLIPR